MKSKNEQLTCQICERVFPSKELFPLSIVHANFFNVIHHEYPSLKQDGFLCHEDFRKCCHTHHRWLVNNQTMQSSKSSDDVLASMAASKLVTGNVNEELSENYTWADKISDSVADFGGSWTFIIWFIILMVVWMIINSLAFLTKAFDPYPFIFLNLVLSCVAALQAPIIMMSQKRQEKRDRIRSEQDYRVNLKAELEIRHIKNMLEGLINITWHGNDKS